MHFGHLIAAQDAFEQYRLDRVVFVPAAQAPLKPQDVQTGAEDRLAMLRAATDGDPRFEIADYELRKGGVSYTIDSVRHFRHQHPADELYWIIGGDQLPKMHLWKDIAELAEAMKRLDSANLQGIREDMDLYDRIRDKISGLTSTLKDMNTLTPHMHRDSDFSELYAVIEKRMKQIGNVEIPQKAFMAILKVDE